MPDHCISKENPIETFWPAENRISKELNQQGTPASGNALWKKVFESIDPNKQLANINAELKNLQKTRAVEKANPKCFVAGTLIHTRDGLKPIEQIKVGDWVLSQPEGKGELSYKRVTHTFVHESNDLWLIRFNYRITDPEQINNAVEGKEINGEKWYLGQEWIVVTGGHPFYAPDKGWVGVGGLASRPGVEIANGDYAYPGCPFKIFLTETANLGWAPMEPGAGSCNNHGYSVTFGVEGPKVEYRKTAPLAEWPFVYDEPLSRTVYNFEVEDNHTYYVGTMGLWAHT